MISAIFGNFGIDGNPRKVDREEERRCDTKIFENRIRLNRDGTEKSTDIR
jgi:hypothetical protein